MSRLMLPFAVLPFLAACELPPDPNLEPEERVLPAEVRSYLLPGQPESIVVQDPDGCYLISVELTEPRSGYYLRDRLTDEPLCYGRDGVRTPFVPRAVAEPAAEDLTPETAGTL